MLTGNKRVSMLDTVNEGLIKSFGISANKSGVLSGLFGKNKKSEAS